ncbi:MAG: voltage-gated chloride channel protein [Chloroflexi bacterium CFX4]|nr:voltage-gated chloride channel protein [Chloroflexi bacterium CFX4]MDL1922833.1 voltage-gated chloride channel protein [Chloroflexi bacterium CFX3]
MIRWAGLGGVVGILAGIASAIFLFSLTWATQTRLANSALLFLLPLVGGIIGWVYQRYGGTAARGTNLVIEEVNSNRARIPLRMAPLVLLGTILTHLFGGSAGREGTAVQMGASLADTLRRALGLHGENRRLLIMAGISGGFGAVFGTPLAGFVFGMEVQRVGRIRYEGIVPCFAAACLGDLTARALGATHTHHAPLAAVPIDLWLLVKVLIAGICFGLTSVLFVELTHAIKHLLGKLIKPIPLRLVLGGCAVIGLVLLFNTQAYLGLSEGLIEQSLTTGDLPTFAFLLKLIFTAVTLGSGFIGGEVTPLFVMGAALGHTLGVPLGIDPFWLAGIGFAAVFAGASNTPLACALMGVELFGSGSALYIALACVTAYLASGHRGIYVAQRIDTPKNKRAVIQPEDSLEIATKRRRREYVPE